MHIVDGVLSTPVLAVGVNVIQHNYKSRQQGGYWKEQMPVRYCRTSSIEVVPSVTDFN